MYTNSLPNEINIRLTSLLKGIRHLKFNSQREKSLINISSRINMTELPKDWSISNTILRWNTLIGK